MYSRELPLGSQSHFRISSLCVCARVPFVLYTVSEPDISIAMSIHLWVSTLSVCTLCETYYAFVEVGQVRTHRAESNDMTGLGLGLG